MNKCLEWYETETEHQQIRTKTTATTSFYVNPSESPKGYVSIWHFTAGSLSSTGLE